MFKLVIATLFVASAYAASVPSDPKVVGIVRSESEVLPDSYQFSYETENGIKAEEHGEIKEVGKDEVVKTAAGSFSYTAPEGENIVVSYVVDENGYQPQGDSIPTPPPVPVQIARALEWIAAHPSVEEKVKGH